MLATEEETEAAAPRVSSALERVREHRAQIAADKTLTLDVPGYEGSLAVRYKSISNDEVNDFVAKAARTEGKELMGINADLLIRCCDAVLVRQSSEAETEPIDEAATTTFSSDTLPSLLGFEAASSRENVFGVFSPDGSHPMAIGQHSDAVTNWLQGKGAEIDQALLGNS